MSWVVEQIVGNAAEFHARPLPDSARAEVWWFEVTEPAIALGSTQPDSVVDRAACAAAGVDVVRRRSGGGAVLLVPGSTIWFDVLVPRGHERWDDDISRAAWWIGDAVARAVGSPDLEVHRGPMVSTEWSRLVCFAGLGPGEVVYRGRKLLGVSQRRTRDFIRLQCAMYRRWEPDRLLRLLRPPVPEPGALDGIVETAELGPAALVAALDD